MKEDRKRGREEGRKRGKGGGFTLKRELNLEEEGNEKDRERDTVKSSQPLLPMTLLGTQ